MNSNEVYYRLIHLMWCSELYTCLHERECLRIMVQVYIINVVICYCIIVIPEVTGLVFFSMCLYWYPCNPVVLVIQLELKAKGLQMATDGGCRGL